MLPCIQPIQVLCTGKYGLYRQAIQTHIGPCRLCKWYAPATTNDTSFMLLGTYSRLLCTHARQVLLGRLTIWRSAANPTTAHMQIGGTRPTAQSKVDTELCKAACMCIQQFASVNRAHVDTCTDHPQHCCMRTILAVCLRQTDVQGEKHHIVGNAAV